MSSWNLQVLAVFPMAAGVLVLALTVLMKRNFHQGLGLSLDFWMAAGFLKLSGNPTWPVILTSALIVIVRKFVVTSLHESLE